MKFNSSRSVIHYETAECIFQTNSEPTMPYYLCSPPRDKTYSIIGPLLYSNHSTVLAFSSFIQRLSALCFFLGLLCSTEKNTPVSSTTSLFALSKSCFSCSPLKGSLFFHSLYTPILWCRITVPTITSSQLPIKTPSLCGFCTLESSPGSTSKPHCSGYTPCKLKQNSWKWELAIRTSNVQQSQAGALVVGQVLQVIPTCSPHQWGPLISKALLLTQNAWHAAHNILLYPKYYITWNDFNISKDNRSSSLFFNIISISPPPTFTATPF